MTASTSSRSCASTPSSARPASPSPSSSADRACDPRPAPSATSAAAAPSSSAAPESRPDRVPEVGVRAGEPLAGVRPCEDGPQVVGDVPRRTPVEQRQHTQDRSRRGPSSTRACRSELSSDGGAGRRRVRRPQHPQREAGVAADELLDPGLGQVGVGELAEQPRADELGRRQHPPLEQHGPLQVAALEQVEPQLDAVRERGGVLDVVRRSGSPPARGTRRPVPAPPAAAAPTRTATRSRPPPRAPRGPGRRVWSDTAIRYPSAAAVRAPDSSSASANVCGPRSTTRAAGSAGTGTMPVRNGRGSRVNSGFPSVRVSIPKLPNAAATAWVEGGTWPRSRGVPGPLPGHSRDREGPPVRRELAPGVVDPLPGDAHAPHEVGGVRVMGDAGVGGHRRCSFLATPGGTGRRARVGPGDRGCQWTTTETCTSP